MGNDILKIVQSPASKVPAYSFNDKNFPAIVWRRQNRRPRV